MLCKFMAYKPYRKSTWKNWLWLIFGVIPMGIVLGLAVFIIIKFSKNKKEETLLEKNARALLKK